MEKKWLVLFSRPRTSVPHYSEPHHPWWRWTYSWRSVWNTVDLHCQCGRQSSSDLHGWGSCRNSCNISNALNCYDATVWSSERFTCSKWCPSWESRFCPHQQWPNSSPEWAPAFGLRTPTVPPQSTVALSELWSLGTRPRGRRGCTTHLGGGYTGQSCNAFSYKWACILGSLTMSQPHLHSQLPKADLRCRVVAQRFVFEGNHLRLVVGKVAGNGLPAEQTLTRCFHWSHF